MQFAIHHLWQGPSHINDSFGVSLACRQSEIRNPLWCEQENN